jgi:hypothetical protein
MNCRYCGKTLDAHWEQKNEKPKEGDFSICGYCGTLSKFNAQLILTPLTPEELVKLNDEDPDLFDQVMKYRKAIVRAQHGVRN